MITHKKIILPAYRKGFHLITDEVLKQLPILPEKGILHLFIQHTSAGLTINENFDPTVRKDLKKIFDNLVPENQAFYIHTSEGDDDMPAHAKSSIVGYSLSIPVSNHALMLGTWQGIYLCEFRNNGGSRHIVATIFSD